MNSKLAGTFHIYRARVGVRQYTAETSVSDFREKANSENARYRIQSCSLCCEDVNMITKLMTTILFVIILSKLYAAIPVMLIFGIALKTILKNAPGYENGAAINKWFAVISEIFVFLMVFRFDLSWMLIKGILLLCVFAYASYSDIKTREAANALQSCFS